jgi:hypothetical protein
MPHRRLLPVLLLPVVVLLAACGGGAAPAAQIQPPSTSDGARAGGAPPGVIGKIAEAAAGTLQVQGTDSQTTVTYTAKTAFSQTVAAKPAVGDCVTAIGTPVSGSTDALTATSVTVFTRSGSDCTFSGDRRPRGSDAPQRPSGAPDRPSGAPGAGSGNDTQRTAFASAVGKVTAVSGRTVTLSGVLREGGRPDQAPTTSAPATPAATTLSVTLGTAATVLRTVPATSAAAVVGKCALAMGKADSAGTVVATSITVSTPGPNGCARFGGFGGAGR